MALDRLSVTRTDFPLSRRGYDRIAVDRHLDELAREIELLQRPSIGAATSAQVQSILDAAEAGAAEIERRAWEEAGRVQDAADQALTRARDQVGALGNASRALRERLESLLAEVHALEGTLDGMTAEDPPATQVHHVVAVPEPQDTVSFEPILEEEPVAIEAPAPPERGGRFGRQPEPPANRTGWFAQGPPAWTGAAAATQSAATQEARESARLVVLNMADGGQPRDAADRYLAGLYAPAERAAILDEIYRNR